MQEARLHRRRKPKKPGEQSRKARLENSDAAPGLSRTLSRGRTAKVLFRHIFLSRSPRRVPTFPPPPSGGAPFETCSLTAINIKASARLVRRSAELRSRARAREKERTRQTGITTFFLRVPRLLIFFSALLFLSLSISLFLSLSLPLPIRPFF